MARIGGIDIPKNKAGWASLKYVYGIGYTTAKKMLDRCGIPYETKVSEWTDENIAAINKRLQDIGCFRGIRHRKGLPLRGQRTKTNSRTRKGRRKTIAGKKKVTR
jgi:small subunit ribosomal protein S13